MAGMTIGKLAAQASVNVETVRYYHRIGLLTEPVREGAYRYYGDEDLHCCIWMR